jgi:hypothetical protein
VYVEVKCTIEKNNQVVEPQMWLNPGLSHKQNNVLHLIILAVQCGIECSIYKFTVVEPKKVANKLRNSCGM